VAASVAVVTRVWRACSIRKVGIVAISRLRRRAALSVFTVFVSAAGRDSTDGLARADVPPPGNDAIANASANAIDMSGDTATFFKPVSNAGATASDDDADGALFTTSAAQKTVWYAFQPSPGLVSVSVSSSDIASIVAGVVTTLGSTE
jgi:hypothetical protein